MTVKKEALVGTIVIVLFFAVVALASDFQVVKTREAIPAKVDIKGQKIGQDIPALFEITSIQSAIDETGQEVKIKGQSARLSISQVDERITMLEKDLARMKAIRGEMDK